MRNWDLYQTVPADHFKDEVAVIKRHLGSPGPLIVTISAPPRAGGVLPAVCGWLATNCFELLTERSRVTWFTHDRDKVSEFCDHCRADVTVSDDTSDFGMIAGQQTLILIDRDIEAPSRVRPSSVLKSIRQRLNNIEHRPCRAVIMPFVATPGMDDLSLAFMADVMFEITGDWKLMERKNRSTGRLCTFQELLPTILGKKK